MSLNSYRRKWAKSLFFGLLLLGAALFTVPQETDAQAPYQWSVPRQIPDYYDYLEPPIMVADRDRTVHAFNLETQDDNTFTIVYRQWSIEHGWTLPVEVLLPEFLGIAPSLMDVILDSDGYFDLIYYGGTRESGSIFFTEALASKAQNAGAWSKPFIITSDAGPLPAGQLLEISQDELLVVFAGNRHGYGIYESVLTSFDSTWTTPQIVHRSETEEFYPGGINLYLDQDGFVEAVWDYSDDTGLAKHTWFGRKNIEDGSWGLIQKLSQADDELEYNGQASIIKGYGGLMVVYYDDFPPTRFVKISEDGGDNWSPPFRPFPHRGGYGYARMVKDSLGNIHMIIGNRVQAPEIHGMWYSRYVGNAWLPLTPITSGPATDTYDPTHPQAVVVQGNVILAAWSNDVREEYRTGAWYSFALLDAPELKIEPLPQEPPTETDQTQVQVNARPQVPESTSEAITVPGSPQEGDIRILTRRAGSPGSIFVLGAIPAIVLVLVALIRRLNQS